MFVVFDELLEVAASLVVQVLNVLLLLRLGQTVLWHRLLQISVFGIGISLNELGKFNWLTCQRWHVVWLEAFVLELAHRLVRVAAEHHDLHHFVQVMCQRRGGFHQVQELLNEYRAGVPFVVLGALLVEPDHIRYQLEVL